MKKIDTTNRHLVGMAGDDIVIFNPPPPMARMSRADALMFAAWLAVLAEGADGDPSFAEVLDAVKST